MPEREPWPAVAYAGAVPLIPHDESDPVLAADAVEGGGLWESRWPPIAAVLGAAALYATMPDSLLQSSGSASSFLEVFRWLVPGLAVALLVPLAVTLPRGRITPVGRLAVPSVKRRTAAVGLVALMSIATGIAVVLLVRLIVSGQHDLNGRELIRAAIHIWCALVLVYALWYWLLDSGGPIARRQQTAGYRDFLFPQLENPAIAPAGWQPGFVDYLYLSFTNATAFSPTDTQPLTPWAKLVMLSESGVSLLLLLMVAARAVNIFT